MSDIICDFAHTRHQVLAESGVLRDNFDRVDIAEVMNDAVELYEPVASEKGQTLTCPIEDNLAVKGNRNLLFRIFANLLDNAIKYAPEGGKISVAATGDKTAVSVVIADNGPGILPVR